MLQDIRVRQRDYLIEMARVLSQELELGPLLWQTLRIATELVGGEAGFIALLDKYGWKIHVTRGFNQDAVKFISRYLDNFYAFGDKEIPSELLQINMLIKQLRGMQFEGISDGVGLPLFGRGKIIGVIVIFRNYQIGFSLNDRMVLKAFTDQAAIAINNANLYSENLREKERLNAIIDSAADGIMVLDVGHRIVRVNQAMLKMLLLKDNRLLGIHHDEVIVFHKVVAGMELSDGEAGGWPLNRDSRLYVEGDLCYGFLSPKPLPVNITYTPVMGKENAIENIIAMVQDISKYREADELKNSFISTVSHELKTPVAIIKGYASTLLLDDAQWDQAILRESLQAIEEESDRLTALISDLLDASRLNSGAVALNRTDLNIAVMTEHIIRRMQPQAPLRVIKSDFPPDFPIVYGDADRIEQVITNFISNAIKYAPKGEILIIGRTDGEFVKVSVQDEGAGIKEEDIPHVFERFYRSKEAMNRAKGIGLGLFLCQAIVEGHGGRICAENRVDRSGAIFSFTLPIDPDDHPATMRFKRNFL